MRHLYYLFAVCALLLICWAGHVGAQGQPTVQWQAQQQFLQNLQNQINTLKASSSTGSGSVGVGGSIPNCQNVMAPPYNAVCDGLTNDQAAFLAATQAGGCFFVPPGTAASPRTCLVTSFTPGPAGSTGVAQTWDFGNRNYTTLKVTGNGGNIACSEGAGGAIQIMNVLDVAIKNVTLQSTGTWTVPGGCFINVGNQPTNAREYLVNDVIQTTTSPSADSIVGVYGNGGVDQLVMDNDFIGSQSTGFAQDIVLLNADNNVVLKDLTIQPNAVNLATGITFDALPSIELNGAGAKIENPQCIKVFNCIRVDSGTQAWVDNLYVAMINNVVNEWWLPGLVLARGDFIFAPAVQITGTCSTLTNQISSVSSTTGLFVNEPVTLIGCGSGGANLTARIVVVSSNAFNLNTTPLTNQSGTNIDLPAYAGHCYRAIVAGTTGTSPPSFPTSPQGTVTDGTATLQEYGTCAAVTDNSNEPVYYASSQPFKAMLAFASEAGTVPYINTLQLTGHNEMGVWLDNVAGGAIQAVTAVGSAQVDISGIQVRGSSTGSQDIVIEGNNITRTLVRPSPYDLGLNTGGQITADSSNEIGGLGAGGWNQSILPASANGVPGVTTQTIGATNGVITGTSLDSVQSVQNYGATPLTTIWNVNSITGSVLTLGSVGPPNLNAEGNPTMVAIPGVGPTCATDGISTPTSLSVTPTAIYSGVTATGSTDYSYQVSSVGPNGCETAAITKVNITNGVATLGDGTWNLLTWTDSAGVAYDKIYGCTGASCTPHYIGFAYPTQNSGAPTTAYFSDFGGFFNSAKKAIASTGTGPYAVDSSYAPPGPTNDTLFTTVVSGGGTTSLTIAGTPTVTGSVTTVLEYDNTTPINQCLASSTSQGLCWVEPGLYEFAGPINETLSGQLRGIPPSSVNATPMQGGSQLVWRGGYDMSQAFTALNTTRGGMRGVGLDVSHYYSGQTATTSKAMAALYVDGNDAGQTGQGAYGNAFMSTFEDVQTLGAWEGLQVGGAFCPSVETDRPSCDSSLANYKNLTFSKGPNGGYGIVQEAWTGSNFSRYDHILCTQWVTAGECFQQYLSGATPDEVDFLNNVLTANSATFDLHTGAIRIALSEDEGTGTSYSVVWRGAPRSQGSVVKLDNNSFNFAEVVMPIQANSYFGVVDSHDNFNGQLSSNGCTAGVCTGCDINSAAQVISEGDACYGGWVKTSSGASGQLVKQIGMQDTSQSPTTLLPNTFIGGTANSFGMSLYYSAAGTAIPSCAATLERQFACVSDSTACTSGTTYTSGGATACLVQCNNAGSAWKETGTNCF